VKIIKEYKNENGRRHRVDGPAVEYVNGTKAWFLNGERHRTDGPAVEWSDGTKFWFLNGKRHRTDGPAIEYSNGTKEWYLNGERITEKKYLKATAYLRCGVWKLIYNRD
jgi:hypothetical protein